MKITINTSVENVEMANFILGQGYKEAIINDEWMKVWGLTKKDLLKAEKFRKALLKGFVQGDADAVLNDETSVATDA